MQHIEPYYNWRHLYRVEEDSKSPFFGKEYSEFEYSETIYNFYIHPQWDYFGSNTLYQKILVADYKSQYAIIELLGEWNDVIENDIMFLKRNVIDVMVSNGICKFILIGDNVLNFHASDNCYYEEWFEDIIDEGGWMVAINLRNHVVKEMKTENIHYYLQMGEQFNDIPWRQYRPQHLVQVVEDRIMKVLG